MPHRVEKSEQEWRHELTEEQYRVLRRKGTEPPFSGEYCDIEKEGVYRCAACGAELFRSGEKFHSGSGWPSFTAPAGEDAVETEIDYSHGVIRNEVKCAGCGSHLGHVFDDGPAPTGQRYCINSIALDLDANE